MSKAICSQCGGVWNNNNPMDMYECEGHCPFSCQYCDKSYLMPKGGYDTTYCSKGCSEMDRKQAEDRARQTRLAESEKGGISPDKVIYKGEK